MKGDKPKKSRQVHETARSPDNAGSQKPRADNIREIVQRSHEEDNELSRYQSLLNSSCDAIIALDRDLKIVFWNKAAENLYGWTSAEATTDLAGSQVREKVLKVITRDETSRTLADKGNWVGETQSYTKDGSELKVRISIGVLWDDNGIFNGIVTIHHRTGIGEQSSDLQFNVKDEIEKRIKERTDELVTANRILRQEIISVKNAAQAAQESEGKNRDLVNNIKLGIFRSTPGPKGKFLEVNIAMEEITGYSRENLLKMNICELYDGHQNKNLFTDDVSLANWRNTREIVINRKSGDQIIVAENILTIRYDSGQILYFDGILEDITERKQAQLQIQQSLERLQKTIKEIIQAMAYIGEVRDPYTAGHQRRVAQLSCEIAKLLGLPDEQFEGLTMAAFVHDIGKILVPADILSKPGTLTRPEFDMIKDHARIGYEILKNIEFPWPIAKIVLQHHERLNGSGYPAGLNANQIIPEARILAVADVVEAMISHRPYRPALGLEKALAEISLNKGSLYDSDTVDACLKLFKEKGFNLN